MMDTPAGFTSESDPIPVIGGPADGAFARYTIVMPFLGGGIPSSMMVIEKVHVYRLRPDKSAWEFAYTEPKGTQ